MLVLIILACECPEGTFRTHARHCAGVPDDRSNQGASDTGDTGDTGESDPEEENDDVAMLADIAAAVKARSS